VLPATRPEPHLYASQNLFERSHPAASLKSRSGKPGLVDNASPSHLFEPGFIRHSVRHLVRNPLTTIFWRREIFSISGETLSLLLGPIFGLVREELHLAARQ